MCNASAVHLLGSTVWYHSNHQLVIGRLKGRFAISCSSDLKDLVGEGWHYRIINRNGDFSSVIPATVIDIMYSDCHFLPLTMVV